MVTINEGWIDARTSKFIESVTKDGSKDYYLTAMIIPFNQVSRNGIMYDKKTVMESKNTLVGCPLMHNHITEGENNYPRGEWEEAWIEEDGLYGKARVYNTAYNKDYIEWLSKASNPRVSLQIVGDAIQQEDEDGKSYELAKVKQFLETSTVVLPGFNDAKTQKFEYLIAESFKNKKNENSSFFEKLNSVRNKVMEE